MFKKFLIKDTFLIVFIIGFIFIVASLIMGRAEYEFSSYHFDFALVGYYLCWFVNYQINNQREKLMKEVVNDFGETVPIMSSMLGKIKEQNDIIRDLQEQLDSK